MAAVGNIALVFALLTMVYGIVLGVLGLKENQWNYKASARGASTASFLLITAACGILWHALLTSDFSLSYVANYTSTDLPWYYRFSAFWAGQAGSLLLWLWLTAALPILVLRSKLPEKIRFHSMFVLHGIGLGFLAILLTATPPFRTLAQVPAEGSGLNPMLQSLGMIIHPPITFLGFALFAVPFAVVLASLFKGGEQPWAAWTRPWLLAAWAALTAGIITGGQWAYTELGWGGYWAWDPVENASLFPWLTSTALLHTLALQRRGRGFAGWNAFLVFLTFILCVFGTFLTRSGLLDSVHAFSDSRVGQLFLVFMAVLGAAALGALIRGRKQAPPTKSAPWFSLDGSFRLASGLLILITAAVFIGTMMPYFSGLAGRSISLEESFYNQMTIPFWLALIALLGLVPALAWFQRRRGRSVLAGAAAFPLTAAGLYIAGIEEPLALVSFALCSGVLVNLLIDSVQQKGRRAAHVVHIGLVLIAFGITGTLFDAETMETVDPGDAFRLNGYTLTYHGLDNSQEGMHTTVSSTLTVERRQRPYGEVRSEKVFHPSYHQPSTNIGVLGSWREDIYFTLSGWDHDRAFLQLSIKPLVAWIWLGSYLMYAGALWLLWKSRREEMGSWKS